MLLPGIPDEVYEEGRVPHEVGGGGLDVRIQCHTDLGVRIAEHLLELVLKGMEKHGFLHYY